MTACRVSAAARVVREVPWAQLRRYEGARAWHVRFVTPACFRRGNRTSPWPAPESLARGLTGRWRELDAQTAPPLPVPGAGPVWVSDIDGHSETGVLVRHVRREGQRRRVEEVISGFVGRVSYICDHGTSDEAAAFDALMAFAAFAGVGSHTAYGFGVIGLEAARRPAGARR